MAYLTNIVKPEPVEGEEEKKEEESIGE